MAFFTSLASGQVLTGTVGNDNFQLSAGSGITILADAGNDVVRGETAVRAEWTMAGGSDTVNLSGDLDSSRVQMGAGNDSIFVSGAISGQSVISMGDGSDTIIAASADNSTITFGNGADLFVATNIESSTVLMGNGNDTLEVESAHESTIGMGAGADVVNVEFDLSSVSLALGSGTDSLSVSAIGSSTVQGGGGADTMTIEFVQSSTINGGAGGDSITVLSGLGSGSVIFGNDGNDTITVNSAEGSAVINGGAGVDSIFLDSAGDDTVRIIGGAGGDAIFVGTNVKFTMETATDSNINGFDSIAFSAGRQSGTVTMSGVATQDIRVASGLEIAGFFATDDEGVASFTSTFATTLAPRAQILSDALGNAESVIFDADGSRYLFIAGSVKGSIVDDVLIDVDAGINSLSANNKTLNFER